MTLPICPAPLPDLPRSSRSPFDISSHEEWFRQYAAVERTVCPYDPYPEDLKLAHTFNVLGHARQIAKEEGYAAPLARACLLAALYHDLGRFAQYRIWKTFKDAASCSHGELGADLAEAYGVLDCEPFVAKTVLAAVRLHNAFHLPDDLSYDSTIVTHVTRDADKLDILRVMDEHLSKKHYEPTVVLSLPDDPSLCSEKVIHAVLNNELAGYTDLTSVNDFRLLLGSWFVHLHSDCARRIMAHDQHARHLLEALPDARYGEARDFLLSRLGQHSN